MSIHPVVLTCATLLLSWQGLWLLRRTGEQAELQRVLGVLWLLVVGLVAAGSGLVLSERVVVGWPELWLGVVVAQGGWGLQGGIAAFVLGLSLVGGILWALLFRPAALSLKALRDSFVVLGGVGVVSVLLYLPLSASLQERKVTEALRTGPPESVEIHSLHLWVLLLLGMVGMCSTGCCFMAGSPVPQRGWRASLPGGKQVAQVLLAVAPLAFLAWSLVCYGGAVLMPGLTGLLLLLVGAVEVRWKGPLHEAWRHWLQPATEPEGAPAGPPGGWARLGARAAALLSWGAARLKGLFEVKSATSAVVKLLMALLLVLLFADVPHRGKMLIEPFKVSAADGKPSVDLGVTLSESLLGTLGLMERDTRPAPALIQAVRPWSDPTRLSAYSTDRIRFMSMTEAVSSTSDVIKDPEFEVAGLKLPLNTLLSPFRSVIRELLGVRSIRGHLHETQGGFMLLARSSLGEAWKVELSRAHLKERLKLEGNVTLADAIPVLAEQLAFEILGSAQGATERGLTQSWRAFEAFRKGMAEWRDYERDSSLKRLAEATAAFREATIEDPSFALAWYRLGVALQHDDQVASAIKAFKTSTQANPGFAPGRIAHAFALRSRPLLLRRSPLSPPAAPAMDPARASKLSRSQLLQVLQSSRDRLARAQAWHALCEQAVVEQGTARAISYFYCERARRSYAALRSSSILTEELRPFEAQVLNLLGMLVRRDAPLAPPRWPARDAPESSLPRQDAGVDLVTAADGGLSLPRDGGLEPLWEWPSGEFPGDGRTDVLLNQSIVKPTSVLPRFDSIQFHVHSGSHAPTSSEVGGILSDEDALEEEPLREEWHCDASLLPPGGVSRAHARAPWRNCASTMRPCRCYRRTPS